MPSDLQPSRIPLTIVTGPTGSGKSTYVRNHRGGNDVVICLDTILTRITGEPEHQAPARFVGRALETRNAMLRKLANDRVHECAWFIISAPDPAERREWAARLKAELVVMTTPLPECIQRIRADVLRAGLQDEMSERAAKWWQANPHLAGKIAPN